MNKAILLALHEVRAFVNDRTGFFFSLLLPIALFALMYGAFSGDSGFQGTAYVVNEDLTGKYSHELLERLNDLSHLEVRQLEADEAHAKLERATITTAIFIPQEFTNQLNAGEQAQLLLKQRGNGGFEGQIVTRIIHGVAEEIAQEVQVVRQVRETVDMSISTASIETIVEKFLDREKRHPVVEVKTTVKGGRNEPIVLFMPGIITMFVLFSLSLSAQSIVEERKNGTLERLLTTQLKISELFIGKSFSSIGRGFVQIFILLVLGYMVFGVFTPVSFLQALVISVFFLAAVSGIGLFIASISRTQAQAVWIGVCFTVVVSMLGGTFFQIRETSSLYILNRLSINSYANDAFKTLISGQGTIADTGTELLVLAGVALVTFILARILFKTSSQGK